MEFVQLVIKTTTGNTAVRRPTDWALPGSRCMCQVRVRRSPGSEQQIFCRRELKLMKPQTYSYFEWDQYAHH